MRLIAVAFILMGISIEPALSNRAYQVDIGVNNSFYDETGSQDLGIRGTVKMELLDEKYFALYAGLRQYLWNASNIYEVRRDSQTQSYLGGDRIYVLPNSREIYLGVEFEAELQKKFNRVTIYLGWDNSLNFLIDERIDKSPLNNFCLTRHTPPQSELCLDENNYDKRSEYIPLVWNSGVTLGLKINIRAIKLVLAPGFEGNVTPYRELKGNPPPYSTRATILRFNTGVEF